jgi:hypothetical protein
MSDNGNQSEVIYSSVGIITEKRLAINSGIEPIA